MAIVHCWRPVQKTHCGQSAAEPGSKDRDVLRKSRMIASALTVGILAVGNAARAECTHSSGWANEAQHHFLVYRNSDPQLGQWVEVTFTVSDEQEHRIAIQQGNKWITYYGRRGKEVEWYVSPGSDIRFEFSICNGNNWVSNTHKEDEPQILPGSTTVTVWGGFPDLAYANFVLRFGRDVRPPGVSGTASNQIFAPKVEPRRDHFHEVYLAFQHNTYQHGSRLTDWLDLGHRALELDVLDSGDWPRNAADPFPYVGHSSPSDGNNCSQQGTQEPRRLSSCLKEIVSWLDAHPISVPLLIFVDLKTTGFGNWQAETVDALDKRIQSFLGARLYSSADLYRFGAGEAWSPGKKGLREIVRDHGWPLIGDLAGKVIIAYTGGEAIDVNENDTLSTAMNYILQSGGRLPNGIVCPESNNKPDELEVGHPASGMSLVNSPHLVCMNLKAQDHYEVVTDTAADNRQVVHIYGDTDLSSGEFPFNYIAVAHGASAIGRQSGAEENFGGSIPFVGVRRPAQMPGFFTMRPSSDTSKCLEVIASARVNGAKVGLASCTDAPNQSFVYSADGKLRPKYDNTFCVDVEGGNAEEGRSIHLWKCGGGKTNEWEIDQTGLFHNHDDRRFCMDSAGSSGTGGVRLRSCSGQPNQKFALKPIAPWKETAF